MTAIEVRAQILGIQVKHIRSYTLRRIDNEKRSHREDQKLFDNQRASAHSKVFKVPHRLVIPEQSATNVAGAFLF